MMIDAVATPRRRPGLDRRAAFPAAGAVVAALTVLVGQAIDAGGGHLGVYFPPFDAHFRPEAHPLALVSALVLVGAAALAPEWIERAGRPRTVAVFLFGLALAMGIGLNVARSGAPALWAIFQTGPHGSPEAAQEYLPGLPALAKGIPFYVSHFPWLITWLPVHVKGNPPGPLIALHLLGIRTAGALAALCIGLGALTAPLAYDLGRTLGDEQRGRTAGLLTAFSPALLLLGVTSVDYVFATLGLAAACLMVRPRAAPRVAGIALVALGTFFSWLLFAIPAWAVIVVLRREGLRHAAALAAGCALAIVGLDAVLALTLGYDPIATLQAVDASYRHGLPRPYAYWLFGSPVAWGIALGLPIAWTMLRALALRDPAALALGAIVLAAAVLGFTKAETERIWLPFVPLACVAAAAVLRPKQLRLSLWLLVAQALAVELLFYTIW